MRLSDSEERRITTLGANHLTTAPLSESATVGVTAWALTTGEDGMRTQARGLAQAVAEIVVEKTVPSPGPWGWIVALSGLAPLPPGFSRPWPDLIVSCGRRSVPVALAIKRASAGRTLLIHVQDPRAHRASFDLIVAMSHDRLPEAPHVMTVPTALHDINPVTLQAAADKWRDRLALLGHPLVGVAVGGDLRGRPFSDSDAERLKRGLRRLRLEFGARLAITPSRRTPASTLALITKTFEGDESVYVWDLKGDNPYRGILALADSLVVTTDSVSMVSEAIATGRPVSVLDLDFPRHRSFVQSLVDQGLAKRFDGSLPTSLAGAGGLDPMTRVANRVRDLVQARTGLVG